MNLEVCWNGARAGQNRGLLLVEADVPRTAPKVVQDTLTARYGRITAAVECALSEWKTVAECAALASCTTDQIHTALRRLHQAGLLEVEWLSQGQGRAAGRKRYRLKGEAPA